MTLKIKLPCLAAPSCGGQIPSLSSDISKINWPRLVGADDIVEIMNQIKESKAPNLGEFIFRGKALNTFKENGSITIPHELLRSVTRYEKDPKCNNEIRGGGTTNKEGPLWAPSGKNRVTPEKYTEIAKLVNADYTQLMNDYDFDRNEPNSKKRFQKSQKRSEEWIKKQIPLMQNHNIILPINVLSDEKAREFHLKFIKEIISSSDNIVALSLNGGSHPDVDKNSHELITIYTKEMSNKDIPVACFDLNSPKDIIFGIQNGIKIFGGQYSFIMAHQHKAFSLPNKDHPNRKCVIIDFKDKERHKNDTGKISEDSSVDLSVGYVAHLCKVGEILETMLLVQHNTNQMERFLDFISNDKEVDFDSISELIQY